VIAESLSLAAAALTLGMLAGWLRPGWFARRYCTPDVILCLVAAGCLLNVIACVLARYWVPGAVWLLYLLLFLWQLWRRRKLRRRLAAPGGKAKARLAAMRQALRERAQPRRGLRPVPVPA
jgi:hypothetical protein